jgi:HEAT repeat protein
MTHDPKKWATPEAVPCVQQILAAENRDVRRLACELLSRIDTPESTQALVRWAVFETDPDLRAAAVEALRRRGNHDVTAQLLRYVRYPLPRAAEHAAEALVALNCKGAVPQLAVMFDQPDPDAPFRVLSNGPAPGPAPAAPGAAALRLAEHVNASKRPDPGVRQKAATELGSYLSEADVTLRRTAAKALAGMGGEAAPALSELEKAAKDADEEVRKFADQALVAVDAAAMERSKKLRESVTALARDLTSTEPEERVKTLYKIATYGTNGNVVGEQVIEAMKDKVGAVQTAATETLQQINPKAHPHVVAILRGKNKREAIAALGELGEEAAIALPLLLACNDNVFLWGGGDPKVGRFFEDLFPVIAKIAPKDKRFSAAVLSCISEPNVKRDRTLRERRVAALAQLGVIDVPAADKVAALVAALDDGEAIVQVIKALEGYGADAKPALPTLRKMKSAPNSATRDAVITAIAKIEVSSPP